MSQRNQKGNKKNTSKQAKMETQKVTRYRKRSSKREVYSNKCLHLEKRKFSNNLTLHLKKKNKLNQKLI